MLQVLVQRLIKYSIGYNVQNIGDNYFTFGKVQAATVYITSSQQMQHGLGLPY
jgi:hypothetical protein